MVCVLVWQVFTASVTSEDKKPHFVHRALSWLHCHNQYKSLFMGFEFVDFFCFIFYLFIYF